MLHPQPSPSSLFSSHLSSCSSPKPLSHFQLSVNSSQLPIDIYLPGSSVGSTFKIYSEWNHLSPCPLLIYRSESPKSLTWITSMVSPLIFLFLPLSFACAQDNHQGDPFQSDVKREKSEFSCIVGGTIKW